MSLRKETKFKPEVVELLSSSEGSDLEIVKPRSDTAPSSRGKRSREASSTKGTTTSPRRSRRRQTPKSPLSPSLKQKMNSSSLQISLGSPRRAATGSDATEPARSPRRAGPFAPLRYQGQTSQNPITFEDSSEEESKKFNSTQQQQPPSQFDCSSSDDELAEWNESFSKQLHQNGSREDQEGIQDSKKAKAVEKGPGVETDDRAELAAYRASANQSTDSEVSSIAVGNLRHGQSPFATSAKASPVNSSANLQGKQRTSARLLKVPRGGRSTRAMTVKAETSLSRRVQPPASSKLSSLLYKDIRKELAATFQSTSALTPKPNRKNTPTTAQDHARKQPGSLNESDSLTCDSSTEKKVNNQSKKTPIEKTLSPNRRTRALSWRRDQLQNLTLDESISKNSTRKGAVDSAIIPERESTPAECVLIAVGTSKSRSSHEQPAGEDSSQARSSIPFPSKEGMQSDKSPDEAISDTGKVIERSVFEDLFLSRRESANTIHGATSENLNSPNLSSDDGASHGSQATVSLKDVDSELGMFADTLIDTGKIKKSGILEDILISSGESAAAINGATSTNSTLENLSSDDGAPHASEATVCLPDVDSDFGHFASPTGKLEKATDELKRLESDSPKGSDPATLEGCLAHEELVFSQSKQIPPLQQQLARDLDADFSGIHARKVKKLADKLFRAQEPLLDSCMTKVGHLNLKEIDQKTRRLISWRFTVYGGTDDILYDFEAKPQQSDIPGAGVGAFVTYLGARRLKEQCIDQGNLILADRVVDLNAAMEPLHAVMPDGRAATVFIEGDNLTGHGNSIYRPLTTFPLHAVFPEASLYPGSKFQRKNETVRICGRDIHLHPLEQQILKNSDEATKRFGFLKLHSEEDYVRDQTLPFPVTQSAIDLGRYGPFLPNDRKTYEHFTLKSFIFSSNPMEWPFDVPEPLLGKVQIIDITSDITGEPHERATQDIPMYVNEVGHSQSLRQNVFIFNRDDRVVNYFFRPCHEMNPGDKVELLTDYKKAYETVRHRKNYGLKNLYEGLPSDDDQSFKFKRDLEDRASAMAALKILDVHEMHRIVTLINENTWTYLVQRAKDDSHPPLTSTQWVAIRRIQWLRHEFLAQLQIISKGEPYLDSEVRFKYDDCKRLLFSVRSSFDHKFPALLSPSTRDMSGDFVRLHLWKELEQEYCFHLRDRLIFPFNRSVWCPHACQLITMLCDVIAPRWMSDFDHHKHDITTEDATFLRTAFLKAAKEAAQKVRFAAVSHDGIETLKFESGLRKESYLSVKWMDLIKIADSMMPTLGGHSTFPVGLKAALLDEIMYLDVAALTNAECFPIPKLLDNSETYVMVRFQGENLNVNQRDLASVPCSPHRLSTRGATINTTWYLVWQVGYVVCCFAQEFFADGLVEEISAAIGVNTELIKFATRTGMTHADDVKRFVRTKLSVAAEKNERNMARRVERRPGERPSILERFSSPTPVNIRGRTSYLNPKSIRKDISCTIASSLLECCLQSSQKRKRARKAVDPLRKRSTDIAPSNPPAKRVPAKLIYEGPPDVHLEGGWPHGWIQQTFERQSGATAGSTDNYWFTPQYRTKIRSIAEVKRFMERLASCEGDEKLALIGFKSR